MGDSVSPADCGLEPDILRLLEGDGDDVSWPSEPRFRDDVQEMESVEAIDDLDDERETCENRESVLDEEIKDDWVEDACRGLMGGGCIREDEAVDRLDSGSTSTGETVNAFSRILKMHYYS